MKRGHLISIFTVCLLFFVSVNASPSQCLLDRINANKQLLKQQNIDYRVNENATLVTIGYSFSGKNLYEQGSYYSNPFGMRIYNLTPTGRMVLSWPRYCGCTTNNETISGEGLDAKTSGICGKA